MRTKDDIWLSTDTPPRRDGQPGLFLDRAGVLVREVNYLKNKEDVALEAGAAGTAEENLATIDTVAVHPDHRGRESRSQRPRSWPWSRLVDARRQLPAPDHSQLMTLPLDAFFEQDTLTVPLQMDERFGDVDWAAFSTRMVELIGNGTGREGCLARLRADNQEQLVQCKDEAQTAYLSILNAFKEARQRTPMRS